MIIAVDTGKRETRKDQLKPILNRETIARLNHFNVSRGRDFNLPIEPYGFDKRHTLDLEPGDERMVFVGTMNCYSPVCYSHYSNCNHC